MNRLRLGLTVLLMAEVAACGTAIVGHMNRPVPPRPPVARIVDAETARHFEELWQQFDNPQPGDWLMLGQAFSVFGFFPEADQCLRQATQVEPQSADNWFWRGLVQNRLGQTSESTSQLGRASQLDRRHVDECHYITARNHLRNNSPQKAEAELRQIKNEHLPGHYLLAYVLVHTSRPAEAVTILNQLISGHPDVHRLYQLRSRAAEMLGDAEMARRDREWAERVPETIATDAVADRLGNRSSSFGLDNRIVRAGRLANPRNLDSVADELNEILKISFRPRVARLLASIELRRGHPALAVELLEQLVTRDGATADTLIELGLAMQAAKIDPVRIHEVFRQALRYRLDPEICRLMAQHVTRHGKQQDVDRLNALLKHAEGLQAYRTNQLETAVKFFQQAAPIAHQHQADSYFFLGESLRHLGRTESSQAAYRHCLELRPHHGRSSRALAIHAGEGD